MLTIVGLPTYPHPWSLRGLQSTAAWQEKPDLNRKRPLAYQTRALPAELFSYVAGGHHFITTNGGRAFSPDSLYLLPNHVKCGAAPISPESQQGMRHFGGGNRNRTRNILITSEVHYLLCYSTILERVLIGSTHNSTSTSESLLPLAITVVYTPLLKESRFHPQYSTLASDCTVRRTRDCDYSTLFPQHPTPHDLVGPGGVEPPGKQ